MKGPNSKNLLNPRNAVKHVNIQNIKTLHIFKAFGKMSFTAREMAAAGELYKAMLRDRKCKIYLALAGSATAAGCMDVPVQMVENNMVDGIVATGASIVDMDFFEALGFRHYRLSQKVDDEKLRQMGIDRIYDTIIKESELQVCDDTIRKIADSLPPGNYASYEFIQAMGKFLHEGGAKKKRSLVETCYKKGVPIFCPAFTDSSAGFGLSKHQAVREKKGRPHVAIDSVRDFRHLTETVIKANEDGGSTGLFMIGGGVPKNFLQDTVVNADMLGHPVNMHKFAIQITVADVRDGGCSSSTLEEANSWGKVDKSQSQMVYDEATKSWPLIVSYAYHQGKWWHRRTTNFLKFLNDLPRP